MWEDLRLSLRSLGRNPGFFAVASLTLALGVGANTAVFSFLEALLLRELPVEKPGELVVLGPGAMGILSRSDRPQADVFSYAQYEALRADNDGVLSEVAAAPTFDTAVYWGEPAAPGEDRPTARCQLVTGSYFPLMGARPLAGRLLTPDDDGAPGENPVVVVSRDFWQGRLGGDEPPVGATVRLQDRPYTIVGVVDPVFRGHALETRTDVWVPMSMQPALTRRPSMLEPTRPYETYWLNILGRLRPGVSREQAEEALNLRLERMFLEQAGAGVSAEDLEDFHVELTSAARGLSSLREPLRRPLLLLWAATGLVLLIACANLANLLLARAAERRREIAIRQALGAGRLHLLRRMLTESAILAATGTALGCALAWGLIPVLEGWLEQMRGTHAVDARLNGATLAFASATGALTIALFGLAPAFWTVRAAVSDALKAGGPTMTLGRGETRAKGLLAAGQFALALVLLSVAGLFLETLGRLRAADLGMETSNVFFLRINPRGAGFTPESQPEMRRRILEAVEALPGVASAAFTGEIPLSGNAGSSTITVPGYQPAQDEDLSIVHVWASAHYFETLGIRLHEGRLFGPDDGGAGDVLVVNRAFAERFFPDRDALGGVIELGGGINATGRIIGVVGNVRQLNLRDAPPPLIYRPATGHADDLQTLLVRSPAAPAAIAEAVRSAVLEAAPGLPVARDFGTIDEYRERAVTLERTLSKLVFAFAVVATLLSALGLYGVLSYVVRCRRGEIGVRQALGATPAAVRTLILGRSAVLLSAGCAAGLLGTAAAGRLAAGLLYEVEPFEWKIVTAALLALTAAAVPAACIPAWRAGRISPAEALRAE